MRCSIFLGHRCLVECDLADHAKTSKPSRHIWLVSDTAGILDLLHHTECSVKKLQPPMGRKSAYVLSFDDCETASSFAERAREQVKVSRCLCATDVVSNGPNLYFRDAKAFDEWFETHLCDFRQIFVQWIFIGSDKIKPTNLDEGLSFLRSQVSGSRMSKVSSIPGVLLVEDFVSGEEESLLMQEIYKLPWQQNLKRRVQHYGHAFEYQSLYIDKRTECVPPLPEFANKIIERLQRYISWRPDQLTINEYEPGQGIGFHVDTHSAFNEAIIVVSLNSGLNLEFRRETCEGQLREFKEYRLSERSLCIFSDEARYDWLHGIKSRKTDLDDDGQVQTRALRVSLTFRLLNWSNDFKCNCKYPNLCDTQNPSSLKTPERVKSVIAEPLISDAIGRQTKSGEISTVAIA